MSLYFFYREQTATGKLDPRVADLWDLPHATFLAEMDLASMLAVVLAAAEKAQSAPPALVSAMMAALPPAAPTVTEALVTGALELYGSVARGSGGREDALPLLAADALFTHAFESQAEEDPAAIPALAHRCARALGAVLGQAHEGSRAQRRRHDRDDRVEEEDRQERGTGSD